MSFAQPFANYEIVDRLGSGSMGTVFKARQKHMDRVVALKVLKPSLARDKKYVDRLQREAQIVGQLNHPNIVTGYDLGAEGGYHFFVMEFVEGRSLRDLLDEWGSFPEDQVLDVATQIARALEHAFECGIIHRDIKPANVLIDTRNRVKVTDMGLAKASTDLTLTRDGATVGTPQYISPEQARDPKAADIRSDLYSLGATLFHMATGQSPFRAESIGELISKVLHERAPSAAGLNPALSDGLSLVIRKLLAKDPKLRYQNPSDLLRDLERLQRAERPAVDVEALSAAEERLDSDADLSASFPGTARVRTLPLVIAAALGALVPTLWFTVWAERGPGSIAAPSLGEEMLLGEKIQILREELATAGADDASDAVRARLRRLVDTLEAELRDQLRSVPGGSEALQGAVLLRHRDADELLDEVVAPVWRERFGCEPGTLDALDPRLADRMREPIDRFRIRLDEGIRRRRTLYLDQLRDDLRAAEVEFDRLLTSGRLAAARAWLDGRGAAFLEQDSTTRIADLDPSFGAEVQLLRSAQNEALQARFDAARSTWLGSLADAVSTARSSRDELLRAVREAALTPQRATRFLDQLERDLSELHPAAEDLGPPGASGRESLRELDSILFEARQRLAVLQAEHAEQEAGAILEFAYRTIPAAGPGSAARFLSRAIGSGTLRATERLQTQVRVLEAAARIQADVLGGEGEDGREFVDRTGTQRRFGAEDFDHLAIPWEELWRAASPDLRPDADRRLGLAFWDLVSGRSRLFDPSGEPVVDVASITLLEQDIAPRIARLVSSEDPRAKQRERSVRFERLRELISRPLDRRALTECESLLQLLGEPRGAFEPRVLAKAYSVATERRRLFDRVDRLRSALGPDAEIRIEEDILVRAGTPSGGEKHWEPSGSGSWSSLGPVSSLEHALTAPLVWPGPGDSAGVRAERVEFGVRVSEHRGEDWLLVSSFGARFLFYLGPRGSFAVGLADTDPPIDAEGFTQAIQPGLLELLEAEGDLPLEGAVESIALRRDGGRVTFLFRGEVLARVDVREGVAIQPGLSCVGSGRFEIGQPVWHVPGPPR